MANERNERREPSTISREDAAAPTLITDPHHNDNWPGRLVAMKVKRLVGTLLKVDSWDEAEAVMRELLAVFKKPKAYTHAMAVLREMEHKAPRSEVAMIGICKWVVDTAHSHGIAPTFASIEHPKAHYRNVSVSPTLKLSPPPPPSAG